jgi:hypothetical protein
MPSHRTPTCTLIGQDHGARPIDPLAAPTATGEPFEYLINTVRHLCRDHGLQDLRYYIVFDTSCPIPRCDEGTVVFIYGDDKCRFPSPYVDARLLLPCLGFEPYFEDSLRLRLSTLLDYARFGKERLENWQRRRALGQDIVEMVRRKTLDLPLGYSTLVDLPIRPIAERRYLTAFAGSLRNLAVGREVGRFSPKRLSGMPKAAARQRMVAELERLRDRLPEHEILIQITESFTQSMSLGGAGYSRTLMDTKVCLAPRGTRMETWRQFEGLRYGAVVISQGLPDKWFYRGSPIITLDDWDQLGPCLDDLLAAPAQMAELHHRALSWWQNVCAPKAIAHRIAARLLASEPTRAVA